MKKKKKLIIYGTGRYAEYAQYVFDQDSDYEVIAFSVEKSYYHRDVFRKQPVIPFEVLDELFSPTSHYLFIAVGQNDARKRLSEEAQDKNFILASYISSKAVTWSNMKIGKNCFIGEGSTIQPFVEIGDNCILFAANVGHHTKIGNNVLASSVTLGGNVEVGENCLLGMNSAIAQNVKIGDQTVIGMGCYISMNTPEKSVYSTKGTFKRKISSEKIVEKFLK